MICFSFCLFLSQISSAFSALVALSAPKIWVCLSISLVHIPLIASRRVKVCLSSAKIAEKTDCNIKSPVSSHIPSSSSRFIESTNSQASSIISFLMLSLVCALSQGHPFSERKILTIWCKSSKVNLVFEMSGSSFITIALE